MTADALAPHRRWRPRLRRRRRPVQRHREWAQFGRQPQRLAVLHCEPDPLDELLAAAGIDPEETP